ncbi:CS1 type fimbrial major subunit [Pseudomonas sp. HLT2-19-2]
MIKQCAFFALTAIAGLMDSVAWAAREQHTFQLFLEVPNRSFYIMPTEPGWIHQLQRLDWNPVTSDLSTVRKYFDVRHESSAIQARLEDWPHLSNGRPFETLNLRVRFNGVDLRPDVAPQDVVSQADAATGVRVLLEIIPLKPWMGYRPGDYSGNVLLMFNAKTPGT